MTHCLQSCLLALGALVEAWEYISTLKMSNASSFLKYSLSSTIIPQKNLRWHLLRLGCSYGSLWRGHLWGLVAGQRKHHYEESSHPWTPNKTSQLCFPRQHQIKCWLLPNGESSHLEKMKLEKNKAKDAAQRLTVPLQISFLCIPRFLPSTMRGKVVTGHSNL